MKTLYRFQCDVCGYGADVAGGEGLKDDEPSTTIVCSSCRALYEVANPIVPIGQEVIIRSNAIRCPKSEAHPIAHWTHPGECPRCGMEMARGARVQPTR